MLNRPAGKDVTVATTPQRGSGSHERPRSGDVLDLRPS